MATFVLVHGGGARATADTDGMFEAPAAAARADPAWAYHEIATIHLVPETEPAELARILLALVG